MRDFASCFNEYAVQLSNTSCSYPNNHTLSSTQNAVVSLYKATLSSHKHDIFIKLTWTNKTPSQGLTITFNHDPQNGVVKLTTNPKLFRKLKGSKTLEPHNIEVFYDLSTARYETGPEPVNGFYVLIAFNSEIVFSIGDLAREALMKKLKPAGSYYKMAKFSLISRQEHFTGNTLYTTKARFSECGNNHEIVIRFAGQNEGLKYPALSVCIDKKTVIRVKRLQWNFRGNQSIFLDGLLIDLMWDVHDWFNNNNNPVGPGLGVFMFRTRIGMDSRLWLEEKMVKKDDHEDTLEFSLMMYACKNIV